jgi:hypothetical protein
MHRLQEELLITSRESRPVSAENVGSAGMVDELTKLRVEAAARAHYAENEFGRVANKAAVDSGTETIKAIVLINGGSCVAILTFIGTLATKDKVPIGLATPLIWFAAGLVMAVIASAFAYFTLPEPRHIRRPNTRNRFYATPTSRSATAFWGNGRGGWPSSQRYAV